MSKKLAWWKNPQTLISMGVGLIAISSWVVNTIVADAQQKARIAKTEEEVKELDATVDVHEQELRDAETRQQLIQQDLGYLKESQKEILNALKKK